MPRRDGTGPAGAGKMTGRGLGPCADAKSAKYATGVGLGLGLGLMGLGLGCRRGFRGGFGRGFSANKSTSGKSQKELLQEQRDLLKSRLEVIEKQLENLQ